MMTLESEKGSTQGCYIHCLFLVSSEPNMDDWNIHLRSVPPWNPGAWIDCPVGSHTTKHLPKVLSTKVPFQIA